MAIAIINAGRWLFAQPSSSITILITWTAGCLTAIDTATLLTNLIVAAVRIGTAACDAATVHAGPLRIAIFGYLTNGRLGAQTRVDITNSRSFAVIIIRTGVSAGIADTDSVT